MMASVKFGPNVKNYERVIIDDFVKFLFEKWNTEFPLKVTRVKTKKNVSGSMDLVSALKGDNIVKLSRDVGIHLGLAMIAHEATHVHQCVRGDLDYNRDTNMIVWKGEDVISVPELNSLSTDKDYERYLNLPWEIESHENQKRLGKEYTNSGRVMELKGKDPTLDMIITAGGL